MQNIFHTLVRLCSLRWPEVPEVNEADVPALASLAVQHGVGPWVMYRLHQEGVSQPWAVQLSAALRPSRMQALMQNAKRKQIVSRIAQAMDDMGLKLTVLKGICLACELYPALDLRPTGDIDVMVCLPDSYRAFDKLFAIGAVGPKIKYRTPVIIESMWPHLLPVSIDGQTVELHFDLFGGGSDYNVNVNVAEHIRPLESIDKCYGLDLSVLLAHLTLHVIKNWRNIGVRFQWLLDIAILIESHISQQPTIVMEALRLNPALKKSMQDVILRSASLMSADSRLAVENALGGKAIDITPIWLSGDNNVEWGSFSHRIKRQWGLLKRAWAYIMAKDESPNVSRLGKLKDFLYDYKTLISDYIITNKTK